MVDKITNKVDKTIFVLHHAKILLLELNQDQELGLTPYIFVKQRVKYLGSLKPTA